MRLFEQEKSQDDGKEKQGRANEVWQQVRALGENTRFAE
jgi:hypothetical protein